MGKSGWKADYPIVLERARPSAGYEDAPVIEKRRVVRETRLCQIRRLVGDVLAVVGETDGQLGADFIRADAIHQRAYD